WAACSPSIAHAELWRLKTASLLGPAPQRSALRKNRRLASTEIVPPAVAASRSRGVASHCETQSAVAPVTFFATTGKLSGRNGKQPHNERKLNNMKTKMISRMQKPKIQRT